MYNDTQCRAHLGHIHSKWRSVPRYVRLLYHCVSIHTPGGPGAAWHKRNKGHTARKSVKPKSAKRVKARSSPMDKRQKESLAVLQAQHGSIRALLMPNGRPIGLEVAQASLALALQVAESYPNFDQLPLRAQLSMVSTLNAWPKCQFVKNMKNLTCWAFAYYMQQDLPEVHSISECRNLAFHGRAARWLRNCFIARNPKNTRFFWGLLQGTKRACAVINKEFVDQAYAKHKAALTKPPQERDEAFTQLLAQADKFGSKLWNGVRVNNKFTKPPSSSASFHSTRNDGGKLAEIQHICQFDEIGFTSNEQHERAYGLTLDNVNDALQHFAKDPKRSHTRVVMVLEPLKARPITAGSAVGSYISNIGQQAMWNHLYERFPCCRLIGEPLTADHIAELDGKSPTDFDHWVSGDYSAATDNLDIQVTKALFEAFLKKAPIPAELAECFRTMLYEQQLVYPDGTVVQQTTGQLMGSPLSFPILCAANMLGYCITWFEYHGWWPKLNDIPCLINGDDILFKANQAFYDIWQRVIAKIGFKLSVGKSYFSKSFCTVNSKLYVFGKHTGSPSTQDQPTAGLPSAALKLKPCLVSFCNPAQFLPAAWIKHDPKPTACDPFVGRLNDMLMRASDQRFALRTFMFMNMEHVRLATKCGKHNLFVPQHLGGLGVKLPNKMWNLEKHYVTNWQLRYAYHCKRSQLAVNLNSNCHIHGFMKPCCATTAVKASCEPKPTIGMHMFHHEYHNGSMHYTYPKFHIRASDQRALTRAQCYVERDFVQQIEPCESNNDILDMVEYGNTIGCMFGKFSSISPNGVLAAQLVRAKLHKFEPSQLQEHIAPAYDGCAHL